jgi:hypothetical protein
MKIIIENATLADDVKKLFTDYYPYLKIELYKMPRGNQELAKKEVIPSNYFMSKFITNPGDININRSVTVTELEKQFFNIGLIIEVYRKSGNVLVETSLTGSWTLQQQNDEAEEISGHFKTYPNPASS